MKPKTERLLQRYMEKLGGLKRSEYGAEDVGMLSDRARQKILAELREEAGDPGRFRLVLARLASLCGGYLYVSFEPL